MEEQIKGLQFQVATLTWRVKQLEETVAKAHPELVKNAGRESFLGMEVVGVGQGKCEGCPNDHYGVECVKVELVGGDYLCLAPVPNAIVK